MLYKIQTGHGGVSQHPAQDIIYIVCTFESLTGHCPEWFFTDGHAKTSISKPYNSPTNLDKIDWDIINEYDWKNTDKDTDRMRRKQAEFLVRHHVPKECIVGIVVYNEESSNFVVEVLRESATGSQLPVAIRPKFYYP